MKRLIALAVTLLLFGCSGKPDTKTYNIKLEIEGRKLSRLKKAIEESDKEEEKITVEDVIIWELETKTNLRKMGFDIKI